MAGRTGRRQDEGWGRRARRVLRAGALLLALAACAGGPGSSPDRGKALLNEVDCHGRDWVEVVNTSGADLDVGGWALADDFTKDGHQYLLPSATILRRGERLVIRQQLDLESGFPFGIGCDKDTVYLLDAAEAVVDQVKPGPVAPGSTWGRLPDLADTWQETSPTAGGVNQPPSTAAAVLFDPGVVNEVALVLPSESLASLEAAPAVWTQGTVTVTAGGAATGPVSTGVRLKGGASFLPLGQKASFRLAFDRFDAGSRVLGLTGLVLNGMAQDPSALHETLAYAVFRAAGLPAARTGYAHVTVNGEDYGLYLVVEAYDGVFTDTHFDTTRHLYEGAADLAADAVAQGGIDVDQGDPDDVRDLQALVSTANDLADADWVAALSLRLDLDAFLRHWAAEGWVGQEDGYATAANNYFLHADDLGFFTMMPWGLDRSFTGAGEAPACGTSVLCRRCLAIAGCASRFDPALAKVHEAALGLGLDARVTALEAVVGPVLAADPKRPFDMTEHDAAVATLRAFLALRAASAGGAFPAP